MANEDPTRTEIPTGRADVRQKDTSTQQRPRAYTDGKKLRKKNEQGLFVYDVTVVSAEYDSQNHLWMYTLNDYKGERIAGRTKETDLE